jgi:hypothetical protein
MTVKITAAKNVTAWRMEGLDRGVSLNKNAQESGGSKPCLEIVWALDYCEMLVSMSLRRAENRKNPSGGCKKELDNDHDRNTRIQQT